MGKCSMPMLMLLVRNCPHNSHVGAIAFVASDTEGFDENEEEILETLDAKFLNDVGA